MKLTRKQELALIDIGLAVHLQSLIPIKNKIKPNKVKGSWSKARHAKFLKPWNDKRAKHRL